MPRWCRRSTRKRKSSGVPIARRRREVPRDLVAPRAAEGVLHDRHELDMGEPQVLRVVGQLLGQVPIGEARTPRAGVHLVDPHRVVGIAVAGVPGGHPVLVAPLVAAGGDDARRRRRMLALAGHRVRLEPHLAVDALDGVLVAGADRGVRHAGRPHARRSLAAHPVGPDPPVVPVADDRDAAGIRRPDREGGAVVLDVCAEHLPEAPVAALADEVEVDVTQQRAGGGGRHAADSTRGPVGLRPVPLP